MSQPQGATTSTGQPKHARRARLLNNTPFMVLIRVEFRQNTENYTVDAGKYQRIESFVEGVDNTREEDYLCNIIVVKAENHSQIVAQRRFDNELRARSLSLMVEPSDEGTYQLMVVDYLPDQLPQVQGMTLVQNLVKQGAISISQSDDVKPKHNSLFDDDDERDMPITANDYKRLQNANKQISVKSQEEIQKLIEEQQKRKEEKSIGKYLKNVKKHGGIEEKKGGAGSSQKKPNPSKNSKTESLGSSLSRSDQISQDAPITTSDQHRTPFGQQFSPLAEVSGDPGFEVLFERFLQLRLQCEQMNCPIPWYPKENGAGDTEYKLMFAEVDQTKLEHRATQMMFRIREGKGIAYYIIGVKDEGTPLGLTTVQMRESLAVLYLLAGKSNAELTIESVKRGQEGHLVEAKVREHEFRTDNMELDIKILLIGSEGAGKSTLLGVLVTGQSDNGQGGSRITVERHKHAILNGYTSSINHGILGFDNKGKITNINDLQLLSQRQILQQSKKILTFIDVPGNEKYAKSMIRGICSHCPDYIMMIVDASEAKIPQSSIDQLNIVMPFNVPIIIVMKKLQILLIDKCSTSQILEKQYEIKELQVFKDQEKVIMAINDSNNKDVVATANVTSLGDMYPIFQVSCVDKRGLKHFIEFLNILPSNKEWLKNEADASEFLITQMHQPNAKKKAQAGQPSASGRGGAGEKVIPDSGSNEFEVILCGIVSKGLIYPRQKMKLGPDKKGQFVKVEIKDIHCNNVSVQSVKAGQICAIKVDLSKNGKELVKTIGSEDLKGKVLVDENSQPNSSWTFIAEIWNLKDPQISSDLGNRSTISIKHNFQPCIHTAQIRQSARVILDKRYILAEGAQLGESDSEASSVMGDAKSAHTFDQAVVSQRQEQQMGQSDQFLEQILVPQDPKNRVRVVFQFLHQPEYLTTNGILVINEGTVKIMGKIIEPFNDGECKHYQRPKKEESFRGMVGQRSKSSAPAEFDTSLQLTSKYTSKKVRKVPLTSQAKASEEGGSSGDAQQNGTGIAFLNQNHQQRPIFQMIRNHRLGMPQSELLGASVQELLPVLKEVPSQDPSYWNEQDKVQPSWSNQQIANEAEERKELDPPIQNAQEEQSSLEEHNQQHINVEDDELQQPNQPVTNKSPSSRHQTNISPHA